MKYEIPEEPENTVVNAKGQMFQKFKPTGQWWMLKDIYFETEIGTWSYLVYKYGPFDDWVKPLPKEPNNDVVNASGQRFTKGRYAGGICWLHYINKNPIGDWKYLFNNYGPFDDLEEKLYDVAIYENDFKASDYKSKLDNEYAIKELEKILQIVTNKATGFKLISYEAEKMLKTYGAFGDNVYEYRIELSDE